ANAGPYAFVVVNSVSCASAGYCSAVGHYEDSNRGNTHGLLLTERRGHWRRGVDATAYDGPPGVVDISSVSCASDGSCSAVGYYAPPVGRNDTSVGVAVLLTKNGGKWRHVDVVMPPDGPGEGAILTS